MKVFSMFLLLAGWFLVASAIALLRPGYVPVFVIAGVAVELLGLALLARQHRLETAQANRPREYRY